MKAIILAAGESKRFKDRGHVVPKPLLNIEYQDRKRRMVEWVMDSCWQTMGFFVALPQEWAHVKLHYCPPVISVPPTSSQAETLRYVLEQEPFRKDEPVLVLDCDTILHYLDIACIAERMKRVPKVCAVGFDIEDANMSRVDMVPHPTYFVEKSMISHWGVVSARGFQSTCLLRRALSGRDYLTPAMNGYPGSAFAHVVLPWLDWGTPERVVRSGATIIGD